MRLRVVIFIPLQLTLGRAVECIRDHVRLLDDLPNGVTMAQKIVTSSILPITKILVIENDKLRSTFLHVAFGSQSMLNLTSDQPPLIPIEGPEKATRGGVNESQSKFLAGI
jgi:hypothetical protein